MNVTIKINDALCNEARHRAVDTGLSLSGWIAKLVQKELAGSENSELGLLEALSMEEGEEKEFEIPRDKSDARELNFSE
jgi:hypothetical protein